MATATKIQSEYEVTLTMNRKEAEVLLFVMRSCGGCDQHSPRKHTTEISNALVDSGVNIREFRTDDKQYSVQFVKQPV